MMVLVERHEAAAWRGDQEEGRWGAAGDGDRSDEYTWCWKISSWEVCCDAVESSI